MKVINNLYETKYYKNHAKMFEQKFEKNSNESVEFEKEFAMANMLYTNCYKVSLDQNGRVTEIKENAEFTNTLLNIGGLGKGFNALQELKEFASEDEYELTKLNQTIRLIAAKLFEKSKAQK